MKMWVFRAGCLVALLGVALLSPLGDLLPVESFNVLMSTSDKATQASYIRVVPSGEDAPVTGWVLLVLGIAVAGISYAVSLRNKAK
jgi:hypothetical protein